MLKGLSWVRFKKFLNSVILRGNDDCWEWQGRLNETGYGTVGFLNLPNLVHRLAWMIHHEGDIPKGKMVLHSCDNPKCVNPKHLYLGDYERNTKDKVERGRQFKPKGSNNPNSKLDESDVKKIKVLMASGKRRREVAKEFKVSVVTIDRITTGMGWKHVQ